MCRLGLLAAALGNGQLAIYDVPCPPYESHQVNILLLPVR